MSTHHPAAAGRLTIGAWGPPAYRDQALAVPRRAVDVGVDHIDTSSFYGSYERGIAFVAYFPFAAGDLRASPALAAATAPIRALPPVVLTIPGTSSIAHLDDNIDAASITLTPAEVAVLSVAAPASYSVLDYLMSRVATSN